MTFSEHRYADASLKSQLHGALKVKSLKAGTWHEQF
jgi:hypothetical protein